MSGPRFTVAFAFFTIFSLSVLVAFSTALHSVVCRPVDAVVRLPSRPCRSPSRGSSAALFILRLFFVDVGTADPSLFSHHHEIILTALGHTFVVSSLLVIERRIGK